MSKNTENRHDDEILQSARAEALRQSNDVAYATSVAVLAAAQILGATRPTPDDSVRASAGEGLDEAQRDDSRATVKVASRRAAQEALSPLVDTLARAISHVREVCRSSTDLAEVVRRDPMAVWPHGRQGLGELLRRERDEIHQQLLFSGGKASTRGSGWSAWEEVVRRVENRLGQAASMTAFGGTAFLVAAINDIGRAIAVVVAVRTGQSVAEIERRLGVALETNEGQVA